MTGIPSKKLSGLHEVLKWFSRAERGVMHAVLTLERLWPAGRSCAGFQSLPQTHLHVLAYGDISCTMIKGTFFLQWKNGEYFPTRVYRSLFIRAGVLLGGGKEK